MLTIGRDAALGDLTVGNTLSVSTGRHLSIAGPIVSGGVTALNVGDQLQVSGAVTTGTSLQATVGGNTTMAGAVITSGAGASITTGGALAFSGLATAGQVGRCSPPRRAPAPAFPAFRSCPVPAACSPPVPT